MARAKTTSRADSQSPIYKAIKYTPLWIEGLAYHEAGHAVMGLVLCIPISRVAIAEACDLPESNGMTEFADLKQLTPLKYALCNLASGPAERLAPNAHLFKTLRGFAVGRRNDNNIAFQAMTPAYQLLRLAESTARRSFRDCTGPLLAQIMARSENQAAIHGVAKSLMSEKQIDGGAIMCFKSQIVLPADLIPCL